MRELRTNITASMAEAASGGEQKESMERINNREWYAGILPGEG
jgi:hypothetical protein